jgi:hypothetical protein
MMNHGTEKRWKFRLQSESHFVFAGSWNPRPPSCDFCDYMYYTLDNTIVEKERF